MIPNSKVLRPEWLDYKDFINKSGIYKITNNVNSKIYIGSASYIRERWNIHLHDLRNNKHHSKYLQNSFNKYGEENFKFEILEIVNECSDKIQLRNNLIEREQYYLNLFHPYDRNIGYNNNPIAQSMLGYKHTAETRRKNSEAQKLQQKLHPRKGKKAAFWGKFGNLHPGSTPILQFDLDHNFIKRWDCIAEIGREFKKIVRPNIIKCCEGKYKHAYGFIWKREKIIHTNG